MKCKKQKLNIYVKENKKKEKKLLINKKETIKIIIIE